MTNCYSGYYGSGRTATDIYTYDRKGRGTWYAVHGSKMVNFTYDVIQDGTNVEFVKDYDCFTSSFEIESEEDLYKAINDSDDEDE